MKVLFSTKKLFNAFKEDFSFWADTKKDLFVDIVEKMKRIEMEKFDCSEVELIAIDKKEVPSYAMEFDLTKEGWEAIATIENYKAVEIEAIEWFLSDGYDLTESVENMSEVVCREGCAEAFIKKYLEDKYELCDFCKKWLDYDSYIESLLSSGELVELDSGFITSVYFS